MSENNSVVQPWLEELPIRMQSTLILGLRGPDGMQLTHVKSITRWLRGLVFKPGNPDNVREFMNVELPDRITDRGPTHGELQHCSVHFYGHLMHALQVVGVWHPDSRIARHGWKLYEDLCALLHVEPEIQAKFETRLGHREWPGGTQPSTAEEAVSLLDNEHRRR